MYVLVLSGRYLQRASFAADSCFNGCCSAACDQMLYVPCGTALGRRVSICSEIQTHKRGAGHAIRPQKWGQAGNCLLHFGVKVLSLRFRPQFWAPRMWQIVPCCDTGLAPRGLNRSIYNVGTRHLSSALTVLRQLVALLLEPRR